MKTVELSKGIYSSVLGFGCAPVLGSVDAKSSKYALDFAIDNGINHLDLARSYGFGEAEKFVGELTSSKKQQIIVASKFGINPNWKAVLFKNLKPLARSVLQNLKSKNVEHSSILQSESTNLSNYFLNRTVPLRGIDMQKSLEKSLRELKRDYLDYYFIHEPHHSLNYFNELKETAEFLKKEGKIRAFGIAYLQSQEHLHKSYLNNFDILQFNNPIGTINYQNLVKSKGHESNIIFSPIRGGNTILSPSEKLRTLLIDFPKSVILCSMFNLKHLQQNINIVEQIVY